MKKTLKLVIALILVASILMSPISVLATEIINEIPSNTEGKDVKAEQKETLESKQDKEEEQKEIKQDVEEGEEKQEDGQVENLINEEKQNNEATTPPNNNQPKDVQQDTDKVENKTLGELELEIILRLPTQDNFTVKLKKDNKEISSKKSKQDNRLYYKFANLEKGTYELTVSGENYITYTQKLEISSDITKISLSNGHNINDLLNNNQTKYGVIGLGDVTGDGIINETDENKMIEKIESKVYDAKFDLNKDKKVDIIDLSYIVFNKNKNIESTPLKMLKLTEENVQIETGTKLTEKGNDISALFIDNNEYVQLQPKNELDISDENPVQITLNIDNTETKTEAIVITPPKEQTNSIKSGEAEIIYVNEKGKEEILTVNIKDASLEVAKQISNVNPVQVASINGLQIALSKKVMTATVQNDGSIVIDLGGQIAIKKVTIKVTKTGSNKLADIAKVEFLNNMEGKIPEPEMDIPENVVATPHSGEFSVTWKKMTNVTGYEVSVTSEGKTEILSTQINNITVSQFGGKKIKNGTPFIVKVQSTNGDWKSGYSASQTVIPEPNKVPPAPESVKIEGGYRHLKLTWKDMEDTDTYNLYYRKEGDVEYKSVMNITQNNYILSELEDLTKYQIYLTGTNKIGTSKPSNQYEGRTISMDPPITSNYKLINTTNGVNATTAHIKDVIYNGGTVADKFDIVDNDYTSSWKLNSWDSGGFNNGRRGPIVELDNFYEIDRIIFVTDAVQKYDYSYWRIYCGDEEGNMVSVGASLQNMTSSNGKNYYEINFNTPVKTNKIQINLALYLAYGDGVISISEIKIYEYDQIETEINDLYSDQMHVTLKEDVTEGKIVELENRLNIVDPVSGEYHYKKDLLQRELDTARLILNDIKIKPAIQIDTTVSKKNDSHLSFAGGLNAGQPLGVVGYAGETIAVYVGSPNKKIGDNTNLSFVATQYHAESSSWIKTVKTLKVGRNELLIPKIQDLAVERGGSLYVEYTGNNANEVYGVRVSGGHEIPMLNISKVTDINERKALVKQYVQELEAYVPTIEKLHNEEHKGSETLVDYNFDQTNCILGATEIVIDKMMYSVSAKQILGALTGTTDQKAEKLYNSLVAMEDMLDLFYQHKGLNDNGGAKNKLPTSKLNIRYQRMFAGAFMYAGGLHIGIEWGSVPGLATSVPVQTDENGKYESGVYFGWGIAHEIGHIINEGAYAKAEITNNYFSVLAQAKDTNGSVRFKYRNVYDKVTSGTKGISSNVFTQLAMYWQLHLAYDKGGYNFKTFDNYQEQFNNLFFARVDTYARDVSKAPKAKENGVDLTLNNADSDNKLMRLSVAAAQKNILEFFEDWGLVPDAETIKYAEQFEKETRRIKFVNDEARAYELARNKGFTEGAIATASIKNEKVDSIVNDTQITIVVGLQNADKAALLGYEIYRNGKSIGFITADQTEFVDTINVNNRVYTYEVAAIDKLLNSTSKVALDPIKVRHDGSIAKDAFTITTNMSSTEDTKEDEDKNCAGMPNVQAVSKLINKNVSDVYTGTTTGNAEIVLELNEVLSIVGFKVTKSNTADELPDYEVQIMNEKQEWETVKNGTFVFDGKISTIYFDKLEENKDPRVQVYDTAYVKLILKNTSKEEMAVSLSELDVLGKPGDNIEILKENGIGTIKTDYVLDAEKNEVIPAGSFIVTGEYSGHPAYNIVKLYDQNGNIIEGMQAIFAMEPENGELGNITEGTWIYYIEPKDIKELPTKVRAELYRVDDALTLDGERLVSDSLVRDVPETLPEINISKEN